MQERMTGIRRQPTTTSNKGDDDLFMSSGRRERETDSAIAPGNTTTLGLNTSVDDASEHYGSTENDSVQGKQPLYPFQKFKYQNDHITDTHAYRATRTTSRSLESYTKHIPMHNAQCAQHNQKDTTYMVNTPNALTRNAQCAKYDKKDTTVKVNTPNIIITQNAKQMLMHKNNTTQTVDTSNTHNIQQLETNNTQHKTVEGSELISKERIQQLIEEGIHNALTQQRTQTVSPIMVQNPNINNMSDSNNTHTIIVKIQKEVKIPIFDGTAEGIETFCTNLATKREELKLRGETDPERELLTRLSEVMITPDTQMWYAGIMRNGKTTSIAQICEELRNLFQKTLSL